MNVLAVVVWGAEEVRHGKSAGYVYLEGSKLAMEEGTSRGGATAQSFQSPGGWVPVRDVHDHPVREPISLTVSCLPHRHHAKWGTVIDDRTHCPPQTTTDADCVRED